ncbi:MAG: MBOAT family protein [Alphaproteobacteria bacterium]|jgi:alginate O-acetyltransferase complex protein AlgI|nr:MBOAT family protein [Alphaproteobacteria bacterium]QQS57089.1 MAG: MBOAT family protein [Alphaproteobacteria bacterium]
MIFASPTFLFLFLPIFLVLYYLAGKNLKSPVISIGSSVFYAWWRLDFLFMLYAIIGFSWLCALLIEKYHETHYRRALWLLRGGVAANLLTLGYFKYFNFGVHSFNDMMMDFGVAIPPEYAHVILPIGVSFFVFHAISYIVDVWRKDTPATRNLFDFAAFIMLFPHLIAGPVLKYKDLVWQFTNRKHSLDLFSEGAYRFMAGFAKKVLIADTVAPLADAAFALENPTMADAWLGTVAYSIQLFFDFAGYSEMAVGLALMMGFRFIENFNNPYTSTSITDFWRRWHISLSTWLRDYLYISLGGSRKGNVRTYINLFLTMLLGGLWHGANWTFILWGAWHGAILAVERALGIKGTAPKNILKRIFMTLLTLVFVMIGWVLFRAHTLGDAIVMYQGMAGLQGIGISDALGWQVKGMQIVALIGGIALIFTMPYFERGRTPVELSKGSSAMKTTPNLLMQAVVGGLFVIAVSRLLAMSYSPFLYFQF